MVLWHMASYDPTYYGDVWAAHYDEIHGNLRVDGEQAAAFLAGLTGDGPVLELGIGTGRVALPLADQGVHVEGVEASTAMLDQLRTKPGGDSIPVHVGDFSEPLPAGPWRVVAVVFNTLFALPTQEAQLRCFRHVAQVLHTDGAFVIECFVPDPARLHPPFVPRTLAVDAKGATIDVAVADPVAQIVHSSWVRHEGTATHTLPVPALRYAWPAELDLMARLAGLALADRSASWNGDPFGSGSRRHISTYRSFR